MAIARDVRPGIEYLDVMPRASQFPRNDSARKARPHHRDRRHYAPLHQLPLWAPIPAELAKRKLRRRVRRDVVGERQRRARSAAFLVETNKMLEPLLARGLRDHRRCSG